MSTFSFVLDTYVFDQYLPPVVVIPLVNNALVRLSVVVVPIAGSDANRNADAAASGLSLVKTSSWLLQDESPKNKPTVKNKILFSLLIKFKVTIDWLF